MRAKGGTGTDGPGAKRQKVSFEDGSDDEGGLGSMKAKILVKLATSKVLHERTAPTQVESWYSHKNHAYRAGLRGGQENRSRSGGGGRWMHIHPQHHNVTGVATKGCGDCDNREGMLQHDDDFCAHEGKSYQRK